MRTMRVGLLAVICVSSVAAPAPAEDSLLKVEVFSTAEFEWSNQRAAASCCDIRMHFFDELESFTQTLSGQLSANPAIAEREAMALFEANHSQLESIAQRQADTLRQAMAYKIERYPAVVFEHGEAVVYGVTDIGKAILIYKEWEARR